MISTYAEKIYIVANSNLFGTGDWFCGRQFFNGLGWGWFWEDSNTLHLLCTLFLLLLLHQLHLRASGIWSWRLGKRDVLEFNTHLINLRTKGSIFKTIKYLQSPSANSTHESNIKDFFFSFFYILHCPEF